MRTLPLLVALATTLSAAHAETRHGAWQVGDDSIHLYNQDLDMNSVAGRAALLRRVEAAATRLCRDTADSGECARQAVAAATRGPAATPLRLALRERGGVQVAAR